jgi:hypothetical protein
MAVQALLAADADKDGRLTEAEWASVPASALWFQRPPFVPGGPRDLAAAGGASACAAATAPQHPEFDT